MEPGGSMSHIHRNCHEPNQFLLFLRHISLTSILTLPSHLYLGLPRFLFPVRIPVYILKGLLSSPVLAKSPAQPYLIDLITLTTLVKRSNYEFLHCETSTVNFHHSWALQIRLWIPFSNIVNLPVEMFLTRETPLNLSVVLRLFVDTISNVITKHCIPLVTTF